MFSGAPPIHAAPVATPSHARRPTHAPRARRSTHSPRARPRFLWVRAPVTSPVASQVELCARDPDRERRPTSCRSDVSIGSMCSAFTSLSSPSSASGSLLSSPRLRPRNLTASASMPAGTFSSLVRH